MPGIRGPGRSRPGWPRPWTRTASHRSPPDLLHRPGTSDQKIRLLHKGRARLPRRQQETQARHSSPPPSPHRAPTPSARPTTNANATKTKRLRPSRPHPGPPPYPDPARHDPQPHPPHPNQPRNHPPPLDTPHRGTRGLVGRVRWCELHKSTVRGSADQSNFGERSVGLGQGSR